MKTKILIILLVVICFSCSNKVFNSVNCIENKDFKKEWDKSINFLTKYYAMRENDSIVQETIAKYDIKEASIETDNYFSSLEFISKYIPIDYPYKSSFSGNIPYHIFLKEKQTWYKWYEKNKCSNIQLK
jgi:hypothetical protein